MRTTALTVISILLVTGSQAQQKSQEEIDKARKLQEQTKKTLADTSIHEGWKHGATTGLNLTQVSYKDWVAGGSNALAYALWLQGESVLTSELTVWSNTYKFAFGQSRLADQGLRKTDDEIYLETLLMYRLGPTINPYAAATLRTQFAPGYDYSSGAATEVSKFFDPAYMIQSAGFEYKPVPEFTTRLGIGLREVFTSQYTRYANEGATEEVRKIRVRGGMESISDYTMSLAENLSIVARLELFAPFDAMDRIIVRNDYLVVAKINKYVTTNLTFNLINDVNVSPRTQMKQALALGATYSLL